jgi:hypothetical protein
VKSITADVTSTAQLPHVFCPFYSMPTMLVAAKAALASSFEEHRRKQRTSIERYAVDDMSCGHEVEPVRRVLRIRTVDPEFTREAVLDWDFRSVEERRFHRVELPPRLWTSIAQLASYRSTREACTGNPERDLAQVGLNAVSLSTHTTFVDRVQPSAPDDDGFISNPINCQSTVAYELQKATMSRNFWRDDHVLQDGGPRVRGCQ